MSKSSLRDFELLQQLGKGSFGTVHKVRRRSTQEILVMKLISIKSLGLRGQQEAQNEVTILASLRHPYIVQYFDSFVENKTLHIVMEFCEKGDLSSVVSGQRGKLLPESKIWKYFIQMCLGLEYIHSKKILHRDIKTLNVFIARDETLRIGDLGVAKKLMSTAAFAHTIVGTPYYLSPELCEDKPYNIKSDIWALGCVLYELCTLKHPFEANNQAALFMKIIRAAFTPIPDSYSAELKRTVTGCLSRDYKKRPSCDEILRMPGMKERALGLNISVPGDSVLSGAPVPIPAAPQAIDAAPLGRGALPVIIEEEKAPKKPFAAALFVDDRRKGPNVLVAPAYAKEFPKPKANPPPPLAVVDMKFNADAIKKQIPRSNEKAAKPQPVAAQKQPRKQSPPAVQRPQSAQASPAVPQGGKPPQANSPAPQPSKPPQAIAQAPQPSKPSQANSPVPQPVKPSQANPPVPLKPSQADFPVPQPVKPVPVAKPQMPPQRVVKAPAANPSAYQPIARVTLYSAARERHPPAVLSCAKYPL